MVNLICPTCGGTGRMITRTTPLDAGTGWHPRGSYVAQAVCTRCTFKGRIALRLQNEQALKQMYYGTIGTLDDAISKAAESFNRGDGKTGGRALIDRGNM